MEWTAFFLAIKEWGSIPLTGILIYVVIYLIRKIDASSKKEEERAIGLRKDINNTLNSFGDRLSVVEKDYVKNDFFYRELSGWRSEINRLSDQISNQFMNFSQSIIQLFNKGNK